MADAENLEIVLQRFISQHFNAGLPLAASDSLFYSGMIDSLGVQEIAAFLSDRGSKEIIATEIVENDLDTVSLLVQWVENG